MPTHEPTAGSLAARIVAFFRAHIEENLNDADIAIKFDIEPKEITPLLNSAVLHGWLRRVQSGRAAAGVVRGHVYSAGPTLIAEERAALAARSRAPAPTTAAQPVAKTRANQGTRLPPLDPTTITVDDDIPEPAKFQPATANYYDAILAKLTKAGQSVPLPIEYRGSATHAVRRYAKANPGCEFAVRKHSETECRIHRRA